MNQRRRWAAFAGLCVAAATLVVAYLVFSTRARKATVDAGHQTLELDRLEPDRRGLLFRSTLSDDTFGKVGFVPIDALAGPWYMTGLTCERVYFQGGRGVCLTIEDTLIPPYAVSIFDDRFRAGPKKPLSGVPSRARLAPDGSRAAFTVFEHGHSYAEHGMSTRTTLLDTRTGAEIGDLEGFTVLRNGAPFKKVDFNFWGVTFVGDGRKFFATLQTEGTPYLVEGDIDRREVRMLRPGIECPSLSPDNQRIAFKKRVAETGGVLWRVGVLDLATMRETVLEAERRSVDDQVEWLDEGHLLYHLSASHGADVWMLATTGAEPPRLLLHGAYSPAVIR